MSRTVVKVKFADFEKTDSAIKRLMYEEKFKETPTPEGMVYKKGNGLFMPERYFKFEYGESELTISGWLSSGFSESDLSGLFGSLPKQQMLSIIQRIKMTVV